MTGCAATDIADAPPRTVLDDVVVEAPQVPATQSELREVSARVPAPPGRVPALPAPQAATDLADPGPPVPPRTLPGWRADAVSQSLPAIRMACAHARAVLAATAHPQPRTAAAAQSPPDLPDDVPPSVAESLTPACTALARLRNPTDAAVRAWVDRYFVAEPQGEGVATGYYEPTLRVSPAREEGRRAAIMAQPPGPTPARAAIYAAVERGEPPAEVLAWADPVEAFFLEIQGSGRLLFPDGTLRRVGYAGQNGQPFVPIGRVLVTRGVMRREEVSFQSLRAWLREAGPGPVRELMERNPSHVFFRWRDDLPLSDGPAGAMGIPLVPLRNVAVDRAFTPLGLPVWIATRHPLTGRPLERLMVAADTGGAIKGRARVDIFWGWDGNAEAGAGRMRDAVQVWVLRPRNPNLQIAEADLDPAPRGRGRARGAEGDAAAVPVAGTTPSGRPVFAVAPGEATR
ncbi:MltA domain-containing protein [Roseomonas sp. CCTCC AB2023176]|uniref:MltA domain-containing protein n=1 Tax=Roseomonas sp. CCTCC AB2023176 TaxID=3342640 RepID=UPI0035DC8760